MFSMLVRKILKFKILFFLVVLQNIIANGSYANGVLCWDRDVRMAMASFANHQNPKAAAETWFPKYIEIKKTKVRWGNTQSNLNGSARNVGKKIASAAIQRNGYTFRFKFNEERTKAFVTLIPPGQYISVPPAKYNKCMVIQDNAKIVTKPTKVKKSYLQRCGLTPKKLENIQASLKTAGFYNGKVDGKFGLRTFNGITKAKSFLGKNASSGECLNTSDISLLRNPIIKKNPIFDKSKLNGYKQFCEEIGFKLGTESFGNCVLKMLDKD